MRKNWIIAGGILLLIAGVAGLIAYKEFMRKPLSALETEAAFTLSPSEIAGSFMADEQKANKMYVGKAIAINGALSDVKQDEKGSYTLVFFDSALNVSISAALDSAQNSKGASLKTGDQVTVKGFCVGFNRDELLGSDILFNRCGISDSDKKP